MSSPNQIAKARASDRLTKAIDDLVAQGSRPHCADQEVSHLWLSEHPEERALAIRLCQGCPVLIECWGAASARRETFGVWGGVDRTRVQGKVGRPPKKAVVDPDEAA